MIIYYEQYHIILWLNDNLKLMEIVSRVYKDFVYYKCLIRTYYYVKTNIVFKKS